jgi:cystathionine beta-lyase/cystathionine gamma-synthase
MLKKKNENLEIIAEQDFGFRTCNIHAGTTADPTTGAILTPIYQTATYVQEAIGKNKGYTYSRTANPTVTALEKNLAALENAKDALCFSTGMAATTTLLLSLLNSGDHIICSDVVYGGTVRLLQKILCRFNIFADFVDTSDLLAIKKSIRPNTKLIFIETPANPTLKLTDIAHVSEIAKDRHIPLVVDNTFLTAALQRPLELGADIVLYSTTKYIDGHNATVGGALLSNHPEFYEQFHFVRNTIGSIQSPLNAWLILQGVKTLDIRMKEHSKNALIIANYLAAHPNIHDVTFPGLPTFPQYALAQKQQSDHGGMITFTIKGGYHSALKFTNALKLCSLAESLGSLETLITHPASMTHAQIPPDERERLQIYEGLIRLSVGLEDVEDIITDLEQALYQCED